MGFGWLFVGYVFTYLVGFTRYTFAATLLGCLMICEGLSRIKEYNPTFGRALYFAFPVFITKAYSCVSLLLKLFEWDIAFFSGNVSIFFSVLEQVSDLAFHVVLYLAIKSITSDLDLGKINNNATRNIVMTLIYYVSALIWMLPISLDDNVKGGIGTTLMVLRLFVGLLNGFLIYSCYMYICPVGDEDMPQKKSRFGFINRFREETARRQQKVADERVASYLRFREKRARRKSEKNKKKK